MERYSLSVTELNNRIKEIIDDDIFLSDVCVRGELSNYKIYPSGHHYFTLKDNESSLRCVMFRSSASRLRFRPESGMSVAAIGRVSVFQRDGVYQLYCNGLIPEGAGDLQLAFEQLKEKLHKEGLFDRSKKKELPEFPERIAIITSSAGAAVHDMIRILRQRWPMSKVLILPVRVQGTEAPAEISWAIEYANKFKLADLIITGRGGGSIEDLWAFNDERVARAIYASIIPVISAVGHEPDVTISDYVADIRASTPSNAAEIAVPEQSELREALNSYGIRAEQALKKKLSYYQQKLFAFKDKRVLQDPVAQLDNRRVVLDYNRDRLCSAQDKILSQKKESFIELASKLDAMSPLRVLSRGYAIASTEHGTSLKSAEEISVGDIINLQFSDGNANCTVNSVQYKQGRK